MKRRNRKQLRLDLRPRTKQGKVAKKRGRRARTRGSDTRHRARPEIDPRHPQHVVLRVTAAVGTLRRRRVYHAIRHALRTSCAPRTDYRVVHLSIQASHVHLLVEADSRRALARGMQGFAICSAKRINRELGRKRGDVYAFRYHATAIKNPTQARNSLSYVLNNWRHHRADAGAPWPVDPFSSAWRVFGTTEPREPLPVVSPQTWLLGDGWRRGGALRPDEIPGPEAEP